MTSAPDNIDLHATWRLREILGHHGVEIPHGDPFEVETARRMADGLREGALIIATVEHDPESGCPSFNFIQRPH